MIRESLDGEAVAHIGLTMTSLQVPAIRCVNEMKLCTDYGLCCATFVMELEKVNDATLDEATIINDDNSLSQAPASASM